VLFRLPPLSLAKLAVPRHSCIARRPLKRELLDVTRCNFLHRAHRNPEAWTAGVLPSYLVDAVDANRGVARVNRATHVQAIGAYFTVQFVAFHL
jgi:hypothetical protein